MAIEDQIRDEKLQYNINRKAAKISSLSSGKIHKYEYLTGKDILPSNQQQIIEQAKLTYSPLGKAFEKQIKTIDDQREKEVTALNTLKSDKNNKLTIEDMIPKNAFSNDEVEKEIDKIKEIEDAIDREKLLYKASGNTLDFKKFKTIITFGKDVYEDKVNLEEADKDQSDLLTEIKNFSEKTRPKNNKKKQEKEIVSNNLYKLYRVREMVLNGFKSKIFLKKFTGTGILKTGNFKLEILTSRQMLQRLPIALAQVKAGNNSDNLLNEIRQIIYSFYQSKENTKKYTIT